MRALPTGLPNSNLLAVSLSISQLSGLHSDFLTCAGYSPDPPGPCPQRSVPRGQTCRLHTCALPCPLFGFGQWEALEGKLQSEQQREVRVHCPGFLSVTLLEVGCISQPETSHPSSYQMASPLSSSLQVLEQLPLRALRPWLGRLLAALPLTDPPPHLQETLLKLSSVTAPSVSCWDSDGYNR